MLGVIGFVAWRLLVAPRDLSRANAYPAPRVTYALLGGGKYVLAQHRGRVVFLDFYASWCIPCQVQTPLVERFARLHPEVDVLPVDVGEQPAVAAAFAKRFGLTRVALDPSALSAGWFQTQGFPTMVVIDPHGMIRATWMGLNPAIDFAMSHAASTLRERTAKAAYVQRR